MERIIVSKRDKKSKKKKKDKERYSVELNSPKTVSLEQGSSGGDKRRSSKHSSSKLSSKSFQKKKTNKDKVKELPSTTEAVECDEGIVERSNEGTEEDEGGKRISKDLSLSSSPSAHPSSVMLPLENEQQKPRKKRPPPRPNSTKQQTSTKSDINCVSLEDEFLLVESLEEGEGESSNSSSRPPRPPTSPHARKKNKRAVPHPPHGEGATPMSPSPSTPLHDSSSSPHLLSPELNLFRTHSQVDDRFLVVNYIHMSLCGLRLCVANEGGKVMAFDFTATAKHHPTKVKLIIVVEGVAPVP